MPSWKEVIAQAEREKDKDALAPYVAPLHYQWLEREEADQMYSPQALIRAADVVANRHKQKRTERFSASGLSKCPRRQLFAYAGLEQTEPSAESANIMRLGTALHFWVMLEGLTMGWLVEAEVFYMDKDLRMGGSLDGILDDGSIWEYKSIASSKYTKITSNPANTFGPSKNEGAESGHLDQLEAYEVLTGANIKSLFYEERNYAKFFEYRLGSDIPRRNKVITLLNELNTHVDDNTLPPMYEDCERKVGYTYNDCPYRKVCPSRVKLWD